MSSSNGSHPVACPIYRLSLYEEMTNEMSHLEVPDYNRTSEDLWPLVQNFYDDYEAGSFGSGDAVSLADFALYLLAKASAEPRVQG